VNSYFQDEPSLNTRPGLRGGSKYVSSKPQYWFVHTVSDILMSLVENGVSLEHSLNTKWMFPPVINGWNKPGPVFLELYGDREKQAAA